MHPALYRGPAMVKPPIVYIAGLQRAPQGGRRRLGLDHRPGRTALFQPPNVAGWDDTRWLDTSTFRGRWIAANEVVGDDIDRPTSPTTTPQRDARTPRSTGAEFWGNPAISRPDPQGLSAYAAPSSRPRPPTGSRAPTGRCGRTRCAC